MHLHGDVGKFLDATGVEEVMLYTYIQKYVLLKLNKVLF